MEKTGLNRNRLRRIHQPAEPADFCPLLFEIMHILWAYRIQFLHLGDALHSKLHEPPASLISNDIPPAILVIVNDFERQDLIGVSAGFPFESRIRILRAVAGWFFG
ncbi:hypothetical protein D3C76_1440400 [compost metagenome]